MNRTEALTFISDCAKEYKKGDIIKSIKRNKHMNNLTGDEEISQDIVEAVVVDFVNFMGHQNAMDWGMYTKDLQ